MINLESLRIKNEDLEKRNKDLEKSLEEIKEKISIKIPENKAEDILQKLKLADAFTKRIIIEYLELDNYEFVKNIASTVNKNNSSEVINFMDGGLSRNTSLIEILKNSIDERKDFYDKIKSETRIK